MQARTFRAAVFAVASALVAAGCATTGNGARGGERDPAAYMPLSVGNRWTYERDFLGEKGDHTVEILKQEDGFFVDSTGRALAVDAYGVRDRDRYLLRGPLESGREWSTIVSVSSMERYKILDVGFACDVPAGGFRDCVRVESKSRIDAQKTMVNEITFAPGVGMVRFDLFLETAQQRIPQGTIVLKSFALAGKTPQGT